MQRHAGDDLRPRKRPCRCRTRDRTTVQEVSIGVGTENAGKPEAQQPQRNLVLRRLYRWQLGRWLHLLGWHLRFSDHSWAGSRVSQGRELLFWGRELRVRRPMWGWERIAVRGLRPLSHLQPSSAGSMGIATVRASKPLSVPLESIIPAMAKPPRQFL